MPIRTLMVLAADASAEPRPRRRARPSYRDGHRLLLHAVVVLGGVWLLSVGVLADSVDVAAAFETMTVDRWAAVFSAVSSALQLPQLYRSGPRVRAKLFIGTGMTMNELLSGEGILRQRISEIVDVALERVLLEYLETSAANEHGRGAWAVVLGISALPPPPTVLPNSSRFWPSVSFERQRLVSCLQYGCLVHGSNASVGSIGLFGTPVQLLEADLDGDSFYQLDLKPSIDVSLVVASSITPQETSTGALVIPGLPAADATSSSVFRNLRLRFFLARILRPLHVETSSVVVRRPLRLASSVYEAHATGSVFLIPVEIHVGENKTLHRMVDGYLRNATLAQEVQEIEPLWTLLAVEVDINSDSDLDGNATAVETAQPKPTSPVFQVAISASGFPFLHLQRRVSAILDAVREKLSSMVSLDAYQINVDHVDMVSSTSFNSPLVASDDDDDSAMFKNSHGDGATSNVLPLDRPFVIYLSLTAENNTSVGATNLDALILTSIANADTRVALGFVDTGDLARTDFAGAAVTFLRVSDAEQGDHSAGDQNGDATRFVLVEIAIGTNKQSGAQVDGIVRYLIRAALLRVLEPVLVQQHEVTEVSVELNVLQSVQISYRVFVQHESQRDAIVQAVRSWRFRQELEANTLNRFTDMAVRVRPHADGSKTRAPILPGTSKVVPLESAFDQWSGIPRTAELFNLYRFGDPSRDGNPSVSSNTTASCATQITDKSAGPFSGCMLLRWTSRLPSRLLFLRGIAVPEDTSISSTNVVIPSATTVNATDAGSVASATSAPWAPGTDALDARTWEIRVLSKSRRNVTLSFLFDVMDTFNSTHPALQLSVQVLLADASTLPDSLPLATQLLSVKRFVGLLVPPVTSANAAQLISSMFLVGSSPSSSSIDLTISLAERSVLGLTSVDTATSDWTDAACSECLPVVEECNQNAECLAISNCFRRLADGDVLLYHKLLELTQTVDITSSLQMCLHSSPEYAWSSRGRSMFLSGLMCVTTSSCPLSASPAGRRLLVQYSPQRITIRAALSAFPLRGSFLLDVGDSVPHNFDVLAPDAEGVSGVQAAAMEVYGNMARGMNVAASQSQDTSTGTVTIHVDFYFMDGGVAALPFVSVMGSGDSFPEVESSDAETLKLVSS